MSRVVFHIMEVWSQNTGFWSLFTIYKKLTQRNSVPRMVNVNNNKVLFTFTGTRAVCRSNIKKLDRHSLAHLRKVMTFG